MTILFSSLAPVNHNPHFGVGVVPVAPMAKVATVNPTPSHKWASDREYREHFLSTTLSVAEYREMKAEAAAMRVERSLMAESAEMAEMGIDTATIEEAARDYAELDAYTYGRSL